MKPEYKIVPWFAENPYNNLTEKEAKEVFEDMQADMAIEEAKSFIY